jgi:nucleotide-binding universal stress UspA family protein
MVRELYVPLLRAACDEAALDAAAAIAEAKEAHLTAMVALTHPLPLVSDMGMVVDEPLPGQMEAERAAVAAVAERARARLSRSSASSEVRMTECFALWGEEAAALQALHCDLSILGKPGHQLPDDFAAFSRMFRSLLLRSGRPVLVVPEGATLPAPARRVVLAWKPTPQASRALHDALPLLSRAAEVDVLVVDPQITEAGYGEQPGADVAHLLARHGLRARVVERPGEGRRTGASILQHVQETDAELLLMGGYGHRHWRELVLGGATRDVVDGARKPVLLSH